MLKYLPFCFPKNSEHHYPSWWEFWTFFDWWFRMFSFLTLTFTLRLKVMDPCVAPSNDSFQEGSTFVTITIQKALADVQAIAFVRFCEKFWDPSCTDFSKVKSYADDFTGRFMTNLNMIYFFINSHPSLCTDSFNMVISSGRVPHFMRYTCATVCELENLFVDIPL